MNTSTAIEAAELFGENKSRPQAASSFGSQNELPKQPSVAFDAAIAGVALTKRTTGVDLGMYYIAHSSETN